MTLPRDAADCSQTETGVEAFPAKGNSSILLSKRLIINTLIYSLVGVAHLDRLQNNLRKKCCTTGPLQGFT